MNTYDVAVIGAGPTGLTLAIDLVRRGARVLLAERGTDLFAGSRGKGIQSRTLEVLDDLGLASRFLAAGGPYPPNLPWTAGTPGDEFRMIEEAEPTESEPYGGTLMLPQWRTARLLRERLTELGGEVSYGHELTGLEQDAEGVRLRFAGRAGSVRARYAVGTDGARGAVRRLLGIGMTGGTVDPKPMLVADVRLAEGALPRTHWHVFPGADGGFAALCPLAGTDDFQFVTAFPEGTAVETDPEAVRAAIAARTHLAPSRVTAVAWASAFTARAALADRFQDGRVFLAGDAAHVHSPAGGQGLNTSIQDAYNLGWKLGAVLAGAPEALLATYEEERRAVAAGMLDLSTRVHRGETRRGKETRQLGLHYRESSLSEHTSGADAPLRAGDRAPDGPFGDAPGERLFDVFRGPHWTYLAVGLGRTPDEVALPFPSTLPAHVRTHAIGPYAPYGQGLFLIRPDGYVAWTGGGEGLAPEGAVAWLERHLGAAAHAAPDGA
ncbi:FAD-dependent monooxygenase [Streptomyces sp. DSM 41982]|uniref:FAD-dependent monooxygenase n=1 Tax=Streptomyces evansiae TaxID=3075535 RepID=A0ABD5E067_9ACTN|nr:MULTISPECIES: FAD-dependent oxidoreductase [unclassified Streptomyces]MDT0414187.1 FAD-dependent monooxygenase [Streptomyces sp. DSM 41982]SCD86542.1 2-polyprenyl-6-methoxyphenol hydroxylase [Streptomyces sp. SolWspMP-sol7th]